MKKVIRLEILFVCLFTWATCTSVEASSRVPRKYDLLFFGGGNLRRVAAESGTILSDIPFTYNQSKIEVHPKLELVALCPTKPSAFTSVRVHDLATGNIVVEFPSERFPGLQTVKPYRGGWVVFGNPNSFITDSRLNTLETMTGVKGTDCAVDPEGDIHVFGWNTIIEYRPGFGIVGQASTPNSFNIVKSLPGTFIAYGKQTSSSRISAFDLRAPDQVILPCTFWVTPREIFPFSPSEILVIFPVDGLSWPVRRGLQMIDPRTIGGFTTIGDAMVNAPSNVIYENIRITARRNETKRLGN